MINRAIAKKICLILKRVLIETELRKADRTVGINCYIFYTPHYFLSNVTSLDTFSFRINIDSSMMFLETHASVV